MVWLIYIKLHKAAPAQCELVAIILGLLGGGRSWDTLFSILLNLSSELLAVGLLFFIMKLTLERALAHQNEKISVVLCHGSERIELPVELRRAEFTRAEILGRVGMIPMKEQGARFSIGHFNTLDFLRAINTIAESEAEDSVLSIPCNEEEFSQFNLPKN
ncbi:hypothetical protein KKHLCK_15045 [Candidatus Electrothrix laxa]